MDRRNFDALNAVAIAYFELNYRAEAAACRVEAASSSSSGLSRAPICSRCRGARTGRLEATPCAMRPRFLRRRRHRDKLSTARTIGRLEAIVGSLSTKEPDPRRATRIRELVARIRESAAAVQSEDQAGRSE